MPETPSGRAGTDGPLESPESAITLTEDEASIIWNLFYRGAQSRTDLARETRFSRSNASAISS